MEPAPRFRITDIRRLRLRTVRHVGQIEPAWDPGGRMPFSVGAGLGVEIRPDLIQAE